MKKTILALTAFTALISCSYADSKLAPEPTDIFDTGTIIGNEPATDTIAVGGLYEGIVIDCSKVSPIGGSITFSDVWEYTQEGNSVTIIINNKEQRRPIMGLENGYVGAFAKQKIKHNFSFTPRKIRAYIWLNTSNGQELLGGGYCIQPPMFTPRTPSL